MSAPLRPLRIVVVAPSRYPLRQPHAGGLEMCVWERVRGLRARGHSVILCGPEGSDFLSGPDELALPTPVWGADEVPSDEDYPAGYLPRIEAALERAMRLIARSHDRIDIVDNHSLHGTPIAWSDWVGVPMITTLHTPPLASMLTAARETVGTDHRYFAVSSHTAREWSDAGVESTVFANGVDTSRWLPGAGGDRLVWFGRIVPEKAPHLAIDAARAARKPIVIAGRIGDEAYFDRFIAPRLGRRAAYVGPLRQPALARLVGRSSAALVTPIWEEPFGMVIAEALATGTPVAAFDVGGVREATGGSPGSAVVPLGDVAALADAASELSRRSRREPGFRADVRAHAVRTHSLSGRHAELERVMAALIRRSHSRTSVDRLGLGVADWGDRIAATS